MAVPVGEAVMMELLHRVPMFSGLSAAELADVAAASRSLNRKKGARVFEEGSVADCCLVLTSGRAKVVVSGAGDAEIILGLVEPFSVVGEIAMLDGSARSAGLVAMEDCQFLRIPAQAFQALRRNPAFENLLLAHVTSTLRRATDQLRAIYSFGAEDRVAWCLGRLAAQRGARQGGVVVIQPRPGHQELADMTGCSRETVSRVLMNLRRKKRVTWDATSLRLDTDALRQRLRASALFADVTEVARVV